MKQAGFNVIRHSWTNRKIVTVLVMLSMVCPLVRVPSPPEAMGQPAPLAAANMQSPQKTAEEIEYEVKAAFIYNFMKFIEWPAEKTESQKASQSPENRMIIGILGDNPFGTAFAPILDKEVHGQKIHLVEIPGYERFCETSREDDPLSSYAAAYANIIQPCNVLFICESEKKHAAALLNLTAGHHILTVSDLSGFAKKGGIIGFVKDNNKIRFEINQAAAQKENIKIRSQLLTLAKEVYESEK